MKRKIQMSLFISALLLITMACGMLAINTPALESTTNSLPATNPANSTLPTDTPVPTEIPPAPTDTPEIIEPTSTPVPISVTVLEKSVYIRRGPGTDYNVLASFLAGQSAVAVARNSDSSWLYIPLPIKPSEYGWVSILTQFTSVQGDVGSLEVKNFEPPNPAIIRNCTFHPMLIKPGNVLLKPKTDTPNNTHKFPPGTYAAYDQNQEGYPKVASFTLNEGDKVDINKDGLGNSYTCP